MYCLPRVMQILYNKCNRIYFHKRQFTQMLLELEPQTGRLQSMQRVRIIILLPCANGTPFPLLETLRACRISPVPSKHTSDVLCLVKCFFMRPTVQPEPWQSLV